MVMEFESLGISGIVPSADFDETTIEFRTEGSTSEYDRNTLRDIEDDSKPLRKNHRSIHIKKTPVHTVKPTIIATTYASFRLSTAQVSLKYFNLKMRFDV